MAFKLRDKQKVRRFCTYCLSLFILIYPLLATNAFATGWKYVSKTYKPSREQWSSYKSPHGGFGPSTDKCRVCHALHDANKDSYRLLFDNSRLTSCDRCHDPVAGLSGKKPYRLFSDYQTNKRRLNYNRKDSGKNPEKPVKINGKKIIVRPNDKKVIAQKTLPPITPVLNAKGEHTPGVNSIPESNIDLPSSFSPDGLTCFSCHDPHFAPENTIQSIPHWRDWGLLKDPGDNGGTADDGLISVQPYSSQSKPIEGASSNPSVDEVKTAFCADCHNKNPNWDRGNDERPNKHAHPVGNVDGEVDVYGKKWQVADTGKLAKSCLSCHSATTEVDDQGNYLGPSSFPHQSVGHKLLNDNYTTESNYLALGNDGGYTGSPYRPLPGLDAGVCRECHVKVGESSPQGF